MEPIDRTEPTSLADLIRPVWSRKWLILAIIVAATVGTYLYFDSRPKEYTAETALYLQATDFEQVLGLGGTSVDPNRNAQNIATLLTSRAVAVEVARRLKDGRSPQELLSHVDASAAQQSDFISVSATDSTPGGAAKLANAFARSLAAVRKDAERTRIATALEAAEKQLASMPRNPETLADRQQLSEQVQNLRALQEVPPVNFEQLDPRRRRVLRQRPIRSAMRRSRYSSRWWPRGYSPTPSSGAIGASSAWRTWSASMSFR